MPKTSRTLVGFALLAALGVVAASPAHAGDAIVPLAANQALDGTKYETHLIATNVGGATRAFTSKFIAVDQNGSSGGTARRVSVGANRTIVVTGVAPAGRPGILLLSGAPQILISARLEASGPNGSLALVNLPVVTGKQVAPGGTELVVQGVGRDSTGRFTDLHVVNASRDNASCTIKTFRGNGQQVDETTTIAVKPLSLRSFEDAFGQLGPNDISGARFAVACNKPFYAYARLQRTGSNLIEVVGPSSTPQ